MDSTEKMPTPESPKVTADAVNPPDSEAPNELSEVKLDQPQGKVATAPVENKGKVMSPRSWNANKRLIDTAQPIESVKDAVSKFGGSVDWKSPHRIHSWERRKFAEHDFEKSEASGADNEKLSKDLESTHKLIEELKSKLEKAEREERKAKQDSELAKLKVEEMEQNIENEASIIAKAQLEADKATHEAAVSELKSKIEELETLHKEYDSMVIERDIAVQQAEEAVAACKELEKTVEDLKHELVATKESLESAQTANVQAEEQRIITDMARDEESGKLKLEIERAEEEIHRLNQHVLSVNELKSKLDASSSVLLDLKAQLGSYVESKLKEVGYEELFKELEEVKLNIEKGTAELNCLREASVSLKSKLEEEKSVLATIRQSEEKASVAVASLKSELDQTNSEITSVQMKVKEAGEKMIELPEKLQQAADEADEAKSLAQAAQVELHEAMEEAEQAKARASATESRLLAAEEELEAAKASEKLAIEATKALQESESSGSNDGMDSPSGVTLSLEEYNELTKRAHEAEEQANMRVAAANSQIEIAKESELRSLEKLEEVNQELIARGESLKNATEKAEMAKEGKLIVEQELRMWRAEQEQQRKAGELNPVAAPAAAIPAPDLSSLKAMVPSKNTESGSLPETKDKKKKKSLFPKVAMFFSKRKTHPTK